MLASCEHDALLLVHEAKPLKLLWTSRV
jgi:hypothetical protein